MIDQPSKKPVMPIVGFVFVALLSACGPGMDRDPNDGIHDPYETQNRKVHKLNKTLDRAVIRPVGRTYSQVMPDGLEAGVSNFSNNLGEPSVVVNSVLQGDLQNAGVTTVRFLVNSVLGFAGLFDVASDAFGIEARDTDFGETLYVWGVGEGAYVELPGLGPSTTRATVGTVVDFFTNPLDYTLPDPEASYGTVAGVASALGQRGRFSDTVDSVLYESSDSYSQARLIYMQNRRFDLGDDTETEEIDPLAIDTSGF